LYRTIVADPPWPYGTPGQIGKTLEHRPNRDKTFASRAGAGSVVRYGAMEIDALCALAPPVADNAHLYLWFTNTFAVEAHTIAKAWGFRPTTILTWTKTRQTDGQPSMKMGYYFRGATEHVLFGVRGSLRLQTKEALPTGYLWPRTGHSVKPDAFYDLVEKASPGEYLELFARRARTGWTTWGNELGAEVAALPTPEPAPSSLRNRDETADLFVCGS
jgi:N6-adenosine-specific RNA methylase IME4